MSEKTDGYRLSVRFGDELMENGFTAVPTAVLQVYRAAGVTPLEMMFAIHVWDYWWNDRNPYPSINGLAKRMRVSRRQLERYSESLQKKGLLTVRDRYTADGGRQLTNEYDFSNFLEAMRREYRKIRQEKGNAFVSSPRDRSVTLSPDRNDGGDKNVALPVTSTSPSPVTNPSSKSDPVETDEKEIDEKGKGNTLKVLWQGTLTDLRGQVTKTIYATWLKPTILLSLENGHAVIGTPTPEGPQWIESRMELALRKALSVRVGRSVAVEVRAI